MRLLSSDRRRCGWAIINYNAAPVNCHLLCRAGLISSESVAGVKIFCKSTFELPFCRMFSLLCSWMDERRMGHGIIKLLLLNVKALWVCAFPCTNRQKTWLTRVICPWLDWMNQKPLQFLVNPANLLWWAPTVPLTQAPPLLNEMWYMCVLVSLKYILRQVVVAVVFVARGVGRTDGDEAAFQCSLYAKLMYSE